MPRCLRHYYYDTIIMRCFCRRCPIFEMLIIDIAAAYYAPILMPPPRFITVDSAMPLPLIDCLLHHFLAATVPLCLRLLRRR